MPLRNRPKIRDLLSGWSVGSAVGRKGVCKEDLQSRHCREGAFHRAGERDERDTTDSRDTLLSFPDYRVRHEALRWVR